jgi:hypothetical protein
LDPLATREEIDASMLTRPEPWFTGPIRASQATSRRNARKAMIVLAARRREREDVERYLAERAI